MHLELFWQFITQPVILTLESVIWLASTLNQYLWPESVPRLDRYIVKPVDTGGCTLMLLMVWNHALLLPIELHGITVWVVEYNIYTHTRAHARTHTHTHTHTYTHVLIRAQITIPLNPICTFTRRIIETQIRCFNKVLNESDAKSRMSFSSNVRVHSATNDLFLFFLFLFSKVYPHEPSIMYNQVCCHSICVTK